MKVLFLDIDGVLNRPGTKERCGRFLGIDRELAKLFTDWFDTTDINIVLSSTWRLYPEMHQHIHDAGISWIGTTEDLGYRGDEVEIWLKNNPEVTKYAILDDIPGGNIGFYERQDHYLVQTDERTGLTSKNIEKLKSIFN